MVSDAKAKGGHSFDKKPLSPLHDIALGAHGISTMDTGSNEQLHEPHSVYCYICNFLQLVTSELTKGKLPEKSSHFHMLTTSDCYLILPYQLYTNVLL